MFKALPDCIHLSPTYIILLLQGTRAYMLAHSCTNAHDHDLASGLFFDSRVSLMPTSNLLSTKSTVDRRACGVQIHEVNMSHQTPC
jgi:hypothetical protein